VSLAQYLGETKFAHITAIETYWQKLCGSRLVPLRSDIDPRAIEDALEYTFIIERIAPGLARFRLAGMHLNDLMGMEVRGMPLTSLLVPSARRTIGDVLESVFQSPGIAELDLKAERGIGKPNLDARMLLLPLKSDLGDISRALGCLETLGPLGRAPRRFELKGVLRQPSEPKVEESPLTEYAFSEDQKPYDPPPHRLSETPFIRLVKDDDKTS
jgi:hypothetical protein